MDETDASAPEPTESVAMTEPGPPTDGDEQLDRFDEDLESVARALDALDADDLDTAEAVVDKLTIDEAAVDQDPVDQDPVDQDPVDQDPVEPDAL